MEERSSSSNQENGISETTVRIFRVPEENETTFLEKCSLIEMSVNWKKHSHPAPQSCRSI